REKNERELGRMTARDRASIAFVTRPLTMLDSSLGKPGAGIRVSLQEYHIMGDNAAIFEPLAEGVTDADGRCMQLFPKPSAEQSKEEQAKLKAGKLYKVVFKTKDYFESTGRKCFYPWVEITFEVANPDEHYHIPLLISPYSYTTYRGS
ncbi:5-hydroxyisourate hydrolase, partial [Grifola frondosa]